MGDRYEEIARKIGDHARTLRGYLGSQSTVAADLEQAAAALRDQDRWYELDDPEHPAPRDGTRVLAVVDDHVRFVAWSELSHISIHGWCLTDQGIEEWDLCQPTHWRPLPAPPLSGRRG
jgi:hypothetical protein